MKDLFKKLDDAKVDVLALVQEEDKTYCISLFEKYSSHVKFIQALLQHTVEAWDTHQQQSKITTGDFYYEVSKLDNQLKKYQEILAGLHEKIVSLIERHFRDTYNIEFESYNLSAKPSEVIIHDSLETIIDHMLQQVGTDLMESGKSQVIQRFQKMFCWPRQQPELKNNKISFPCFYSLGYGSATSLSWEDKNVLSLLQAINLIIYDSSILSETFRLQYKEWQEQIEYNKAYMLQSDITIKFFKNRRIDLTLPSAHTAEKFWQLYQLETIILSNNMD